MKVIVTVIVTAVVVAGLYAGGQWWLSARAAEEAKGPAVRLEPVMKGDLVEIVSSPGIIQPDEKVSISARVSARIAELKVEECDAVKKGDVLVVLDSKDLKASLRQTEARKAAQGANIKVSEARIEAAKAQIVATEVGLADARRDLERQKKLLASSDVSQSVVDTAQAKVDRFDAELASAKDSLEADRRNIKVMEHNLEAAAADIARAEDNLDYATIKSPIDGVVTKLNAKVGEVVVVGTMNNAGTVVLEVADLSRMLMVAKVDETSVANVEVGQKAQVRTPAYPDKVFFGAVDTVALAHTDDRDGTKYFKVEVLLNTEGKRIQSGLTADVDIQTKRHKDVLKVPSQAVLGRSVDGLPAAVRDLPEVEKRKTMTPAVYRLIDGKSVVTPVKIGASDVMHTIIESGLKEGDVIVAGPYKILESLQHDQKLRDEKATTQPAVGTAVATK